MSLLPFIEKWCDSFERSRDCFISGEKINVRIILKDRIESGSLEVMAIKDSSETIGFCAHTVKEGYLDGVALWIEPEHRGNVEIVFDKLLCLAKERLLYGISFSSKVWGKAPLEIGFTAKETIIDGDDVVTTWIKKCT